MFKIGDVVKLKSGGTMMTVSEQLIDGRVVCGWFDDCRYKREAFLPEQLEKVEMDERKNAG